jgi:drug/metabolite transporter (DMT)-like permease
VRRDQWLVRTAPRILVSCRVTSHAHAAANRRGIVFMTSGMGCLVLNDSMMKYMVGSFDVAQIVVVRGLMAVTMLFAIARATGATSRLPRLANRTVGLRVVLDSLTTLLFIGSLMHLPIGNATAINLASPLMMALFAAFFLGEHPGPLRWLAIGAGFGGVVLVIQPRVDDFNAWALMCVAATVFQAWRDLLTRRIPPEIPGILIALGSLAFVTLVASALLLLQEWKPVSVRDVGLLAIAAALLALGYWLIVNSMRHGEVSVVAPFRYSGLLVALTTGFIVWGDVPSPMAWSGIALLFASGIYLLHADRRRRIADLPAG